MLESLTISNVGIISEASIELDPGLTVLTGETGAGKSMILQSIGLLMGNRGSTELIFAGADLARVDCEAKFNSTACARVLELVEESGGECEEIRGSGEHSLLLSREISQSGRGKIFLGGRQVPASVLKDVSENLIALHGQSDQVLLRDPPKQLELLDRAGAGLVARTKAAYQVARRAYRSLCKEYDQLRISESDQRSRIFTLEQGIGEISELKLVTDEDIEITQKISVMRNVDDLSNTVGRARELLAGSADFAQGSLSESVLDQLAEILKSLEHACELDPELETHRARVVSASAEMADLDSELGQYVTGLGADPLELSQLETRISELSGVKKKYGPSLTDVINWHAQALVELESLRTRDSRMSELEGEIEEALAVMSKEAEALSKARAQTAKKLKASIESELSALAMPYAQVAIELDSLADPDSWTRSGKDQIMFMLAAHEGAKFLPLSKSASGGELSRVMLAIEVALAGEDPVPTMIFDEVDAGIGGAVAVEVGRRLAALAEHTQVIVVTHLPQVAAFADRHLVVEKTAQAKSVQTTVARVQGEERVREITRMLSGLPDSEHGGAHALELLDLAAR